MFKVRTLTAKTTQIADSVAKTFLWYRRSSVAARIFCTALGSETSRHKGLACNLLGLRNTQACPCMEPSRSSGTLGSLSIAGYPGVGNPPTPDPRAPLVGLCPVLSAGCPCGGTPRHSCYASNTKPATILHLQRGWCPVLMGLGFLVRDLQCCLVSEQMKGLSVSKSSR